MVDNKMDILRSKPWKALNRLYQCRQTLTPDFSCNHFMSVTEQWMSVFASLLIGAYWQSLGMQVIPTAIWSSVLGAELFSQGIEHRSVFAVSTMGTRMNREIFIEGLRVICNRIQPDAVLCYCKPYPEMHHLAKLICIEHEGSRARCLSGSRQNPNQISLVEDFN